MNLSPQSLLLLIAVICFVLAGVGIGLGGISLTAIGLAAFAASFLIGNSGFRLR
jgi:hypothetical protein